MAQDTTMLKNSAGQIGHDYDALVAQLASLRDDVAKLAHSATASGNRAGHALAQDVTDGVAEATRYVTSKTHQADVRVEAAVAANPYIALGLAAAAGVLIGAMTRR
jgi:ElaB/YqjD/DUF883 family membrane-anchored ribosome-binding protein